jgi:hypothetical protein
MVLGLYEYRLVGRNMLNLVLYILYKPGDCLAIYRVLIQLRFQQETSTNSNF